MKYIDYITVLSYATHLPNHVLEESFHYTPVLRIWEPQDEFNYPV